MQRRPPRPARPNGYRRATKAVEGGDEEQAASLLDRYLRRMRRIRSWAARRRGGLPAYRLAIGVIGLILTLAGVVLLVLPGPGWLLIFMGLGVWATEFPWAKSLLRFVQRTLRAWTEWVRRLPRGLLVALIGAGLATIAAVLAYLLIR
jgi:uncharacterized protein (TIGR02611 family)